MNESWKPKCPYTSAKIIPFTIDINIIHFLTERSLILKEEEMRTSWNIGRYAQVCQKRCMYFCVNLMNTNNTKFNNKKTFRKHCYNIKISIHIMNIYFCTDVCAKWSSKRTQCPVSKTHAPSLRESFACSDTTEIKYQPIIPMYCSASSACADSAVDSNPMIRCLSCGTTNNTKHPIVQRNFLPACQAVAIGPAANSMHAHVRLAVCQASSVPSARLRACYRNPICRLSGNPSVGVSS